MINCAIKKFYVIDSSHCKGFNNKYLLLEWAFEAGSLKHILSKLIIW